MTSRITAIFAVALTATLASAQQASWTLANPTTSPPPMVAHAMAYDFSRLRCVVYGGARETWEWDNKDWKSIKTTASPAATAGYAMVYDWTRRRVVLFGGYGTFGHSNETWEYDGSNWTQITTTGAPSVRRFPAMAYDNHRNRIVLFGGGVSGTFNDTWEYDGAARTWTQINTATTPPNRYFFGMAYDQARQRTVMFGGGDNSIYHADTWEYDGTDWTLRTTGSAPSQRWGHTMVYDPYRQTMVLVGGRYQNNYYNDTWEYDGQRWIPIAPTGTLPAVRQAHGMAFDLVFNRMVVFGGQNATSSSLSDTWTYQSGRISARFDTFGQGCGPMPTCKLTAAAGSLPQLGMNFTMVADNLPVNAAAALMTIGLNKTAPVSLAPYGLPGCFLYHSLDLILGFPVAAGTGRFGFTVPNQASAVGAMVYVQAAAGNAVSNAGEIRVGDQ